MSELTPLGQSETSDAWRIVIESGSDEPPLTSTQAMFLVAVWTRPGLRFSVERLEADPPSRGQSVS